MTSLQIKEREIKDLKIINKTLKNKIEVLEDIAKEKGKENEKKFKRLEEKIEGMFKTIVKMEKELEANKIEIRDLKNENEKLRKELEGANNIIKNLKARINKDSTNSSKPSSTDGYKKTIHNSREKTGRKSGGQK